MEYRFAYEPLRSVESAAWCFFDKPIPHPSRLMAVHDFVYMVDGRWSARLGGETVQAENGDVMILPAGIEHRGAAPCRAATRTMYFHIYAAPSDGQAEAQGVALPTLVHAAQQPHIGVLFEKIIATRDNAAVVTAYINALLFELGEACSAQSSASPAQQMRQYILASRTIPTNRDIAAQCGISVRTAEVVFKKAYGQTLHRFAVESKLKIARHYLADYPTMTLSSIAAALGFYDEFHFSKAFKAAYGISPREYKPAIKHNDK